MEVATVSALNVDFSSNMVSNILKNSILLILKDISSVHFTREDIFIYAFAAYFIVWPEIINFCIHNKQICKYFISEYF